MISRSHDCVDAILLRLGTGRFQVCASYSNHDVKAGTNWSNCCPESGRNVTYCLFFDSSEPSVLSLKLVVGARGDLA